MSPVQRTKSGCWTCRLRRKKCDEDGMPCKNCQSRGLHCHGYGLKPAWKDRGEKEKKEANRLQLQSRTRRKSRSSIVSIMDGLLHEPELVSTGLTDPVANTGSVPTTTSTGTGTISTTTTAADDTNMDMKIMETLAPSDTDLSISNLGLSSGSSDLDFLEPLEFPSDLAWDTSTADLWMSTTCVSDSMAFVNDKNPHLDGNMIEQSAAHSKPAAVPWFPLNTDKDSDERESELVTHFLDETFSLQHSASESSTVQNKSWVLSLLMRSSTFYAASLSLSAYHYFTTPTIGEEAQAVAFQDYQKYRGLALDGLTQLTDREIGPVGSGKELASSEFMICSVQMAVLEAFGKNMQDCQSHLSSAARFLVEKWDTLATDPGSSPDVSATYTQLIAASKRGSSPSQPSMQRQALAYFRSLLIWNDVILSSSQMCASTARDSYTKLLADDEFATAFEDQMCCEAWVLDSILDATDLVVWKTHQEAQGVLSVRELVNRAQRIESFLDNKIPKLYDIINDQKYSVSRRKSSYNTYLFAHALFVHLNAIISSPWPELHEIKSSVEKAVSAWQAHPEWIDLRTLAWPLCVTASLVTGPNRDWFRKLVTDHFLKGQTIGTAPSWISILDECWSGFDNQSMEKNILQCDWRNALQRLNFNIICA